MSFAPSDRGFSSDREAIVRVGPTMTIARPRFRMPRGAGHLGPAGHRPVGSEMQVSEWSSAHSRDDRAAPGTMTPELEVAWVHAALPVLWLAGGRAATINWLVRACFREPVTERNSVASGVPRCRNTGGLIDKLAVDEYRPNGRLVSGSARDRDTFPAHKSRYDGERACAAQRCVAVVPLPGRDRAERYQRWSTGATSRRAWRGLCGSR